MNVSDWIATPFNLKWRIQALNFTCKRNSLICVWTLKLDPCLIISAAVEHFLLAF